MWVPCSNCGGSGNVKVKVLDEEGNGEFDYEYDDVCDMCDGFAEMFLRDDGTVRQCTWEEYDVWPQREKIQLFLEKLTCQFETIKDEHNEQAVPGAPGVL